MWEVTYTATNFASKHLVVSGSTLAQLQQQLLPQKLHHPKDIGKTGKQFACACVHPLNRNSVGASNLIAGKWTSAKLKFSEKPFRWCFKWCSLLQTRFSMANIGRFLRRFSNYRFFGSRFSWLCKDFQDSTPKITVTAYVWYFQGHAFLWFDFQFMVLLIKEEMHQSDVGLL